MSHIDFSAGSISPSRLHPSLQQELGRSNLKTLSAKKGVFMLLLKMPGFHKADYMLVYVFSSRNAAFINPWENTNNLPAGRGLPLSADNMNPRQTQEAAIVLHKWAQKKDLAIEIVPEYRVIEEALFAKSLHLSCKESSPETRNRRHKEYKDRRRDRNTELQNTQDELGDFDCLPAF